MSRINLLGGTYQARSVIADAQRCVNLYPEANPPTDQDHPVTHYLTPGTNLLSSPPTPGKARCEYRATNGNFYRVVGTSVYFVGPNWQHVLLGTIDSTNGICYMSDNGLAAVLVDGTLKAYVINLSSATGVNTLNVFAGGSGYTDGTYTQVPLLGGTGSGAFATIYIFGGVVVGAKISFAGSGYQPNDKLTFNNSYVMSTGAGARLNVTGLLSYQFGVLTSPNYLGANKVDYIDTFFLWNVPNTNHWYSDLGNSTFDILTGPIGGMLTGNVTAGGSGYSDGVYENVPLTGGHGSGAEATIYVESGSIVIVIITAPGTLYQLHDSIGVDGSIATGTISNAGAAYTDGSYTDVPLTGGSGVGATADITVAGNIVTVVTITSGGLGYLVSDTLSANASDIGGTGSGFVYTVSTLAGTGFAYQVAQVSGAGLDPLYIASKTGSPDPIVNIAVVHTEIWLIGTLTTEVWYNAGGITFPFQRLPGTFVEHGLAAQNSLARNDLSLFWLSQDRQGEAVIVQTEGYALKRISTHAIENAINQYPTISDAIGYTYQQEGHVFFVLTFPAANVTWVYDITIGLWHQRAFIDSNGILNAIRSTVSAFPYGTNIGGDSSNGNLYQINLEEQTDYYDGLGPNSDGSYPITRIRAFPHLVDEFDRVTYRNFIADMEAGNDDGELDTSTPDNPPLVSLRWSDNRGKSYGNRLEQSLGSAGQYLTTLQWNRLGYARDRVFELSWSVPALTALQGAFIEVIKEAS